MKNKLIYIIIFSFLFSSNIQILEDEEIKSIEGFYNYIEDVPFSFYENEMNLFDIYNFEFEYQIFNAPAKSTTTTLNP